MITWHDDRIECEADPRQAERLINECRLTGANPMGAPGAKLTYQDHEADTPLEKHLRTAFTGFAARSNYLSADRFDFQHAREDVRRSMPSPAGQSWEALKRICRYLCGLPRLVYTYRKQEINSPNRACLYGVLASKIYMGSYVTVFVPVASLVFIKICAKADVTLPVLQPQHP